VVPGVGKRIVVQEIGVAIPEFRMRGRLLFKQERGMAIEVVSLGELEEQVVPGVRIDLGEVEISLADIIGIRSGSVIRLGPGAPHRCFLRIGSSTLAEGEVLPEGDALAVTITRVL
jgi:flagellar motor switch/type III secretory pathway protein FliN